MEMLELNSKRRKRKKIFIFMLAALAVAVALLIYFNWKIYSVSKKININEDTSFISSVQTVVSSAVAPRHAELKGEIDGRINILLLGLGGENHPGKNLTDTIMIASIDTKNKKVAFFSLPRDLYINIPRTSYSTKINQIYQYGLNNNEGVEPLKKTVEETTGLEIQYFLIVDFEGFKKVVDDIGGVNIMVERDIYDSRYPGPNYSYEIFELKKGFHHLDGATALKYARMRHNDPEGDFGRAKRQQQIIQAVKNRVFSIQTILNPVVLNNLLNTLGNHVKTNVTLPEIESFIALSKEVDIQNINNVVADAWKKDSLLKGSHLATANGWMSILIPRVGNWSEIQDLAQNVFDLDKIKKRQAEIENEEAVIAVINQSKDNVLANKVKNLLKDKLGMKNVSVAYLQIKLARDKSFVIDNTNGRKLFTLDELLKKLPAKLESENSDIIKLDKNYDFIVMLGNDLVDKYFYDEVSMDEWEKYQDEQ